MQSTTIKRTQAFIAFPFYILYRFLYLAAYAIFTPSSVEMSQLVSEALILSVPVGICAVFFCATFPDGSRWRAAALIGIPTILGPLATILRISSRSPQLLRGMMSTSYFYVISWLVLGVAVWVSSLVITKYLATRSKTAV